MGGTMPHCGRHYAALSRNPSNADDEGEDGESREKENEDEDEDGDEYEDMGVLLNLLPSPFWLKSNTLGSGRASGRRSGRGGTFSEVGPARDASTASVTLGRHERARQTAPDVNRRQGGPHV